MASNEDPRIKPYFEPAAKLWLRNFNTILKKWMSEGHGYNELQRLAGISKSAFYYYQVGQRTPSLGTVTKIAEAMGVPIEMFFRRS